MYTHANLGAEARIIVLALSLYAESVWWPQLRTDAGITPTPQVMADLRDRQYISITADSDTGIELIELADRGWRWLRETVTGGDYPPDLSDAEGQMFAAVAEVAQRARREGRHFVEVYQPVRRRWSATATTGPRPGYAELEAGTQLDHVSHEIDIRAKVEQVFHDGPTRTINAVARLLNYAPRPDETTVNDNGRDLRADETALIWDTPMTGPHVRRRWLRRADALALIWGTPLFGADSLTRGPLELYA